MHSSNISGCSIEDLVQVNGMSELKPREFSLAQRNLRKKKIYLDCLHILNILKSSHMKDSRGEICVYNDVSF